MAGGVFTPAAAASISVPRFVYLCIRVLCALGSTRRMAGWGRPSHEDPGGRVGYFPSSAFLEG